ncbi:hypothetical protein [Paenibacillus lautus]|uniref:hypothetical protein n=1 Tax=Paenibacillus lautus TaxID=1401 RepID=UPI001C1261A5|nr:hypothetical protein [Paenibacillus lautus]MBU5345839.1 hypothetical protein [Paenibacillus lautus]
MKIVSQVQEDEVIAEFLFAEVNSDRFKEGILHALGDHDLNLLIKPNLNDQAENQIRRDILGQTRGFGRNTDMFENFPTEVKWYKAFFEKQDLNEVMYINYSYWNELSNNTRLPLQASKNIMSQIEVFGISNQGFLDINLALKNGKVFPRLIFVSMNENSRVVVLEGHARLTAYYLDNDYIPDELEVIIGFSDKFSVWDLY